MDTDANDIEEQGIEGKRAARTRPLLDKSAQETKKKMKKKRKGLSW